MKNNNEVLASLEDERTLLTIKINKLDDFLNSNNSNHISNKQFRILQAQFATMNVYHSILDFRIEDLQNDTN